MDTDLQNNIEPRFEFGFGLSDIRRSNIANLHITVTKIVGSDAEDADLILVWEAGKVASNGKGSASVVLWYGYIFLSFFFFSNLM